MQAGCAGWLHACIPKSSLLRSQSAVAVSVSPVSGSCTLVQLYYSHNMKFPANLVYPVLEGHDSINVARIESSAISARMHSSQQQARARARAGLAWKHPSSGRSRRDPPLREHPIYCIFVRPHHAYSRHTLTPYPSREGSACRGGTCDRSRHTPLSARKSHPPQARPPNSGRPPRLRYPPRTHSPGGRPPQEKHRPTRRSRHAQRLASMPFGGGGDSRRRNLPRQRNVAGLSRVGDLASTLAYHRGMPLRAPIARERLRACAQWGDQLRGQLGKGAETLTSAIVGTPFLRSPEHAWRCDQR